MREDVVSTNSNRPWEELPVTDRPDLWKRFQQDIIQITQGHMILPVTKEVELEKGVSRATLSWGQIETGYSTLRDGSRGWTLFFIRYTQGGMPTGEGMAFLYNHGKGKIVEFAICEHKKVDDPTADHRRGWYPGHCEKCGLDMTYDSGD